jgi:DNA-binding winged helix-turn-helix (wHTH) protein
MGVKYLKFLFSILIVVIVFAIGISQDGEDDSHLKVAMRMIGHQVLLNCGDSTSLVLPIEKVENRYKIGFGSEIVIIPDELEEIVNNVIAKYNLAEHYYVEVEHCETKELVYSYEVKQDIDSEMMPCRGRDLPLDCYEIYIKIPDSTFDKGEVLSTELQNGGNYFTRFLLLLGLLSLFGLFIYLWKKRNRINPNFISIGDYQFDKINMELILQEKRMELTSKEADLLYLLHSSANELIGREDILKAVWGDEGDYVGRTLDVFISKLRKKLIADPNVKIVNIRGVGYKLIINDDKF